VDVFEGVGGLDEDVSGGGSGSGADTFVRVGVILGPF
jgi:hypothetical protein